MIRRIALYIGIIVLSLGCQPQRRPASRDADGATGHATTAPARTLETFDAPGITLSHPVDWPRSYSDDRVVILEVLGTPSLPLSYAAVSLDIPKLPPHVPGFIPLGLVVNGYVDDLKKQRPGITIGKPEELKVAGATARRVRSRWELHGATKVEDAVLTVHGDRVYIFRANGEATDEQAAREALDQVLASVKWK